MGVEQEALGFYRGQLSAASGAKIVIQGISEFALVTVTGASISNFKAAKTMAHDPNRLT